MKFVVIFCMFVLSLALANPVEDVATANATTNESAKATSTANETTNATANAAGNVTACTTATATVTANAAANITAKATSTAKETTTATATANETASSRGCRYEMGKCVEPCPEGTHEYKSGCNHRMPEPTCDTPEPLLDTQEVNCDYSSCYCDEPTVRDEKTNRCVKVDKCCNETPGFLNGFFIFPSCLDEDYSEETTEETTEEAIEETTEVAMTAPSKQTKNESDNNVKPPQKIPYYFFSILG